MIDALSPLCQRRNDRSLFPDPRISSARRNTQHNTVRAYLVLHRGLRLHAALDFPHLARVPIWLIQCWGRLLLQSLDPIQILLNSLALMIHRLSEYDGISTRPLERCFEIPECGIFGLVGSGVTQSREGSEAKARPASKSKPYLTTCGLLSAKRPSTSADLPSHRNPHLCPHFVLNISYIPKIIEFSVPDSTQITLRDHLDARLPLLSAHHCRRP